jgi:hypothetical protein
MMIRKVIGPFQIFLFTPHPPISAGS